MNVFATKCPVCRKTIQPGARSGEQDGRLRHERCLTDAKPAFSRKASSSPDRWSGDLGPKTGPHSLNSKLSWDSFSKSGKITPIIAQSKNYLPHDWSTPLVAPPGLSYYPFQEEGIHAILSRRNTLLADEMGVGKTIQAIGALNNAPDLQTVLLVTPASLRYNWRAELSRWLVSSPLRIIGLFPECSLDEVDLAIVSYAQLAKVPPTAKFDLLLLDEAHCAKNPDAARTKAVRSVANRSKRLLFLTGSPIENRTEELWTLLQMLDPDTWDPPLLFNGQPIPQPPDAGFHRFAIQYCGAKTTVIVKKIKLPNGEIQKKKQRFFDFKGATNLPELHQKLKQSCMVRRLKRDVLPQLPPKIREVIVLPRVEALVDAEAKAFAATGLDYESDIEHLQKALILFPELAAARHASALAKVPYVIAHCEKLLDGDGVGKLVVFAHHQDVISALTDAFDRYQSVVYRGESSEAMRDRAVRLFQENEDTRVFVGSLTAAGVGLTLTAASHMVFAEIDWKDMRQAEDRIHRVGQEKNVCLYQTLVFDWSIDANMLKKILEKMRIAEVAIDGKDQTIPG